MLIVPSEKREVTIVADVTAELKIHKAKVFEVPLKVPDGKQRKIDCLLR